MTENDFKQYLQDKKSVHLPDDFDNNMMFLIKENALKKSSDRKYLKLMYIFFIAGLALGFSIAVTFVDLEFKIGDYNFIINKLILLIPLIVIILFLFEKIYKATLVSIGKEKF
jgi:hypothetical protein